MRLLSLELSDFRNIERCSLEPSPRATVVVGPNGQGKTNLLEALYLLVTLKPLRAGRLSELLRFGQPRAEVRARFALGGATRDIAVVVEDGERQAFVGGKRVRELDEYFGGVSVVAFTPDDLELIKGGPEGRRRFLDRAVWGRFPAYLAESREYARALKARNRLLREGADDGLLEAFTAPLALAGARLVERRRAFVRELGPHFERALEAMTGGALRARVRYAPAALEGANGLADVTARLSEELQRRTARDRERGFTSAGPHADNLGLSLDGRPARAYASQGQQRALVLALKIAEIENLREAQGHYPLLLLDDVSSELDRDRNEKLMSYLAALDGQVLLTTTDASLVARGADPAARFYAVAQGVFSAIAAPPIGTPAPGPRE